MTQLTNNYIHEFNEILQKIKIAKQNIYTHANHTLIEMYWQIGTVISQKVISAGWGKGVVKELSTYILQNDPTIKGFSDKNLWRMKQLYETYQNNSKLSALLREIPWTHNTTIFSRCKTVEEQEFYLSMTIKERYSSRELERQISASLFERTMVGNQNISAALRELHPSIDNIFKDNYVLEFLGLPVAHSENDLQKAIIQNMKNFILELGKDFVFIGEEYRIQVGNTDFYIDLLFLNRELSALVAFEIKIEKFKPEHLGQLNFYLEALDMDIKKPHENPSIGILLCRDKDDEVVEYAMNRHLSPTLVAQYSTILPSKKLLHDKLQEISLMLEVEQDART
jgi:predicted nuclease of restriction endonuclease-like (RecB) superfamily